MKLSYTTFSTDFGEIGLSWSSLGLLQLQLPEKGTRILKQKILEGRGQSAEYVKSSEDMPRWVIKLIHQIQKHFAGQPLSFQKVPVDWSSITPFFERVYREVQSMGVGEIASYGEVAQRVGSPKASRAVGQAMARNPVPLIVPCHRVVSHGMKMGGFSAGGGVKTKKKMLELEGVSI